MSDEDLRGALEQLPAGWRGQFLAEVTSTQDVARAAAAAGAASKSIVVADFQTAGRGRQGRSWLARPGQALMLSLLLRRGGTEPRPWRFTALASVALAEAIEVLLPELSVTIKWPNDLVIADRKVAGVLAESTWDGERLTVIVGVGVNVLASERDMAAVGAPATSLLIASNRTIRRDRLLLMYVAKLDRWLNRAEEDLLAAWQSRLWGKGQRVRLADIALDEEVVVLGATFDGALRVRRADGREITTTTGELIL
jgi:BirA family transcriptional regulator, biotin operon repressor / biotin---[acetyl-CoA-carboxylase] ligase